MKYAAFDQLGEFLFDFHSDEVDLFQVLIEAKTTSPDAASVQIISLIGGEDRP